MPSLEPPKTPGLISLKPNGPRTSSTLDIGSGQQWLHAVADAISGSHPVARVETGTDPLNFQAEGGSKLSITPAGSEDEFFDQRDRLVRAFEVAVGRPPAVEGGTEDDDAFWEALAAINDAYRGPTLDPDAVLGGLS